MKAALSVPDVWSWSLKSKSDEVFVGGADHRNAVFHPKWSDGTAAVRGTRVLNRGPPAKYYWEVCLPERIFGTSTMFGIATERCPLNAENYINLIGEDNQGWALSHKGLVWHAGSQRRFCKPFEENVKTTVGLLFDSRRGTLTYFKDGVELGVAFTGLDKVKDELYPMVSSTAARIVVILENTRKIYYNNSLFDRCCEKILEHLDSRNDVSQLPLPNSLQNYLNYFHEF